MRMTQLFTGRTLRTAAALLGICTLAACEHGQPVAAAGDRPLRLPGTVIQAFDCTASRTAGVACAPVRPSTGAASGIIIGGLGTYINLASSNTVYDVGTEIFQSDVTVQNLLKEALGSPDGVTPDPEGIRVFFHAGPTVTSGTGTITVANPDGFADFTANGQPYFAYHQILKKDSVSAARSWRFAMSPTVDSFSFRVLVETDVQYLLVINEVLANPGGSIADANGEWFEIYNAGSLPVHLRGLLIADSSAMGRRPYDSIPSDSTLAPGRYAVLGTNADTTQNGGVPVDYAYGTALTLANSLDAIKIGRVYGSDTLTVDRVSYLSAAISAQDGISRELKNPALDNSNVDGSNWADAALTPVYGLGGRGTPRAQNSAFVAVP